MTMVGKILVLLNMAMSLFFMGAAVMVYTTRTDLRGQLSKKTEESNKLSGEKTAIQRDLDELNKTKTSLEESIKAAEQKHTADADGLRKQIAGLEAEVTEQRTKATEYLRNMEVAHKEQQTRREQVEKLRQDRDNLFAKNGALVTANTKLDDQLAQETNKLALATSRNQQLVELVKKYETFITAKQGVLPTDAELERGKEGPAPPPDVEGIVTNVDAAGRFIEISLGEDDGIQKDQILQVWRMTPTSRYIGKIKIFTTQATTAVAQPVNLAGTVQKDDRVGPRILTTGGN